MIEGQRVYCKAEGIVLRKIGDEHILVPIVQNLGDLQNLFAINDTAAFIFEHFDGSRNTTQICELLADQCLVPAAQIEEEIVKYVDQLLALGIIMPAAGPLPN